MKKLLSLLFVLIITTAFISGCGKPSTEKVYDYVSKVAYNTSYDDVIDEIGEETKTLGKGVSPSGKLNGLTGRWIMDDKNGSQNNWIELDFNSDGLWSVTIYPAIVDEIAKKRNHYCDVEFVENASYIIQGDVDYNGLTYKKLVEILGKEGLVRYRIKGTTEKRYPHTQYIWYDRNGKSIWITFRDENPNIK